MLTIAYNVYACAGWPDELVNTAVADSLPFRMAQALLALQPDILTFSEAPDETTVHKLGRELGLNSAFFPTGGNWPGALFTRVPILNTKEGREFSTDPSLFTRHAGRAVLSTAGGEIVLYSAHLHPSNPDIRHEEIAHLVEQIKDDIRNDQKVILQGDLNHEPSEPEYDLWTSSGLTDTWVASRTDDGNTIKADAPSRRIDYIFVSPSIAGLLRSARVVRESPFGPDNAGDPPSFFLSDHLPVLAEFEMEK